MTGEETTHRGVRWQRDPDGGLRFYDADGERWMRWAPGADAPPLPPEWAVRNPGGGLDRPSLRSRWRLVPIVLTVAVVIIAVVQGLRPSAGQAHKEAKATAALLRKCLPQDGTTGGRPRYAATPVPCGAANAAVRVVQVVPSTPGSPVCPSGTTGMELPYPGVQYLHVLCIEAVRPGP